jgi:hypothetical protein
MFIPKFSNTVYYNNNNYYHYYIYIYYYLYIEYYTVPIGKHKFTLCFSYERALSVLIYLLMMKFHAD